MAASCQWLASCKPVQIASMVIVRLRDGRFVERWEQMDLLGLMLQLGVVAQPGQGGDDA